MIPRCFRDVSAIFRAVSAIFCDFPRFSVYFCAFSVVRIDFPRFSAIFRDFPRFSAIFRDFPRFSAIFRDFPHCCLTPHADPVTPKMSVAHVGRDGPRREEHMRLLHPRARTWRTLHPQIGSRAWFEVEAAQILPRSASPLSCAAACCLSSGAVFTPRFVTWLWLLCWGYARACALASGHLAAGSVANTSPSSADISPAAIVPHLLRSADTRLVAPEHDAAPVEAHSGSIGTLADLPVEVFGGPQPSLSSLAQIPVFPDSSSSLGALVAAPGPPPAVVPNDTDVGPEFEGELCVPVAPSGRWCTWDERSAFARERDPGSYCGFCGGLTYGLASSHLCCRAGNASYPSMMRPYPADFQRSVGEYARRNSLLVNQDLQISTFAVDGRRVTFPSGPSAYTIVGSTYHFLNPAKTNRFSPLHAFRTWALPKGANSTTASAGNSRHQQVMPRIVEFLERDNPLFAGLRSAADILTDAAGVVRSDVELVFSQETQPTARNEVAAVVDALSIHKAVDQRQLVIRGKNASAPNAVSSLSEWYETLQFPLLFWHGELGWGLSEKARTKVTLQAYTQMRMLQDWRFRSFPGVSQQWLTDSYLRIEDSRLNLVKIRAAAAAKEGKADPALPDSFVRSPAWYARRMENALFTLSTLGPYDYFITLTASPSWAPVRTLAAAADVSPGEDVVAVAQVFHAKMKELFKWMKQNSVELFGGPTQALLFTVEWQKRGLPHIHSLWKFHTSETVEEKLARVNAEVSRDDLTDEDRALINRFMTHNCTALCRSPETSQCGQQRCRRGFPQPIAESNSLDDKGIPIHRRRQPEDTHVVEHMIPLLRKWGAHANVKVSAAARVISYLLGYVMKGSDRALYYLKLKEKGPLEAFRSARYVSSSEAAWRMLEYENVSASPSVNVLVVPGGGFLSSRTFESAESTEVDTSGRHSDSLDDAPPPPPRRGKGRGKKGKRQKKLGPAVPAYFADLEDPGSNNGVLQWLYRPAAFANTTCLGYHETATVARKAKRSTTNLHHERDSRGHYVYRRPSGRALVRFATVHMASRDRERFFLRCVLQHDPLAVAVRCLRGEPQGPCFERLRRGYSSFEELVDTELPETVQANWSRLFWEEELKMKRSPAALRQSFLLLCAHAQWGLAEYTKYHDELAADISGTPQWVRDELWRRLAAAAPEYGVNVFGGPGPDAAAATPSQREFAASCSRKLNAEQRAVFDEVLRSLAPGAPAVRIALTSVAGAGKTFLLRCLMAAAADRKVHAWATGSTGVAASLFDYGGRTVHRAFGIPITEDKLRSGSCGPDVHAKGLRLLIIDEVTVLPRAAWRWVDDCLRRKKNAPFSIFGGDVSVVAGGDWRQLHTVVPEARSKTDILCATVKPALAAGGFQPRALTRPMRSSADPRWSAMLNSFADGGVTCAYTHTVHKHGAGGARARAAAVEEERLVSVPVGPDVDLVELPSWVPMAPTADEALLWLYPELFSAAPSPLRPGAWSEGNAFQPAHLQAVVDLSKRLFICDTNRETDLVNQHVYSRWPGETHVVRSNTELWLGDEKLDAGGIFQDASYLDAARAGTVPPGTLNLKVGQPVLLMVNVATSRPKYTRCLLTSVKASGRACLVPISKLGVGVWSDEARASEFCVPRLQFEWKEKDLHVRRWQLPLLPAWAVTPHKSQGMTASRVAMLGVEPKAVASALRHPSLAQRVAAKSTHGTAYVAMSRVGASTAFRIVRSRWVARKVLKELLGGANEAFWALSDTPFGGAVRGPACGPSPKIQTLRDLPVDPASPEHDLQDPYFTTAAVLREEEAEEEAVSRLQSLTELRFEHDAVEEP